MPCLSILLKGADLVGDQQLKIRRPLKCKYIKLLHCYTNLNSSNFQSVGHAAGTTNQQRLLFAKFDFINADQYDNFNNGHSYVSLGASSHGTGDALVVRDLYKVLLDKPVIHLQGDLKIRLYFLDPTGEIVPLESGDVNKTSSGNNLEVSFINIIIEYEEMI